MTAQLATKKRRLGKVQGPMIFWKSLKLEVFVWNDGRKMSLHDVNMSN